MEFEIVVPISEELRDEVLGLLADRHQQICRATGRWHCYRVADLDEHERVRNAIRALEEAK